MRITRVTSLYKGVKYIFQPNVQGLKAVYTENIFIFILDGKHFYLFFNLFFNLLQNSIFYNMSLVHQWIIMFASGAL